MHRNHHHEAYGITALILAALMAAFVAMMLPDLKRYMRIQRM